jgi:adenosine deaminase
MPKAELHVHLEGTMQPETVLALAEKHGMWEGLPGHTLEDVKKWFVFSDFGNFLDVYMVISDLLRDGDDFELLSYACGADMARQGIVYREVTFTPYTHTHYLDKDLTIEMMLDGLRRGAQRAKEEFGVVMRWVFDIPRNIAFAMGETEVYDATPAMMTLDYAVKGMKDGVVALGLGGSEVNALPAPFAHAFVEAKKLGLKSAPHAGETKGADSVRDAVELLLADRIGHGVRAMEDEDLLAMLIERQIPLEVNPTSNICLKVFEEMEDHPFKKLDEMGVFVTVNSDDPPLFNTNLVNEYKVLHEVFGYDEEGLARIARRAFEASFAEEGLKKQMLDGFDAWVNENLE